MQSDTTRCLLIATRFAGGEKSRGAGASKGLSERAPLPPGHILHSPPRRETQTNTHMQAITQKKTQKEIICHIVFVLFCFFYAASEFRRRYYYVIISFLQTNTDVMISRVAVHKHRGDRERTRQGMADQIGRSASF